MCHSRKPVYTGLYERLYAQMVHTPNVLEEEMNTAVSGVEITCPECNETLTVRWSGSGRFKYCGCGITCTDGYSFMIKKKPETPLFSKGD